MTVIEVISVFPPPGSWVIRSFSHLFVLSCGNYLSRGSDGRLAAWHEAPALPLPPDPLVSNSEL